MKMTFLKLFLICTFKDPNLAENLTNLADTPKKLDPAGFMGLAFSNSRDPLWSQGNTKCQGEWW